MRYLYKGTVVESGKPLDSALFVPVKDTEADKPKPTAKKRGGKDVRNSK